MVDKANIISESGVKNKKGQWLKIVVTVGGNRPNQSIWFRTFHCMKKNKTWTN